MAGPEEVGDRPPRLLSGFTGCLVALVGLSLVTVIVAGASLLVWRDRRLDTSRCPPPVAEGVEVRVALGGWAEPDSCIYTYRGTSAQAQESVFAE